MSFLLNNSNLKGTNAERRIAQVIEKGTSATQAYKLKDTTGKLNAYRKYYTDEQYNYVKETLREMICFCGYAGQTPNSFTNFFEYKNLTQTEIEVNWTSVSDKAQKRIEKMSKDELDAVQFETS